MSAPRRDKAPVDEDVDIEIEEDYSDDVEVEVEMDEGRADEKKRNVDAHSDLPASRPATPLAPVALSAIARPATPHVAHNATAPSSSLASLDGPSASPSTAFPPPTASSLPHPLPSASSFSSTSAVSRDLTPACATETSTSALSASTASAPTTATSQLHDSHAANLSAVHHFSSPLQLGSSSASSSSAISLNSTAGRQQQHTAAQLEQLVDALNADNARLLLQIKQRDAHIEQLTQQHTRDKKRLRDECEQIRHELSIAQSSKRTALEDEGDTGKELARMREEWDKERMSWKDRENQLQYELNRLSATPSAAPLPPSTSPFVRPPLSPRPGPSDDRSAYITELQQLLRERDTQLHQQADKLAWYAENQQLLSDSHAAHDQAQARIKQLERQIHTSSPNKGRGGFAAASASTEPRSLPADTKRIQQLEKEIQQLRRRLATPAVPAAGREDAAVAGLIEAAKGGEEGEVARELRGRVMELEEEMKAREEDWERRLRVMRQEQDKIRVGFEKKVRLLQEGVKGRLAQLKGKKRLSTVGVSGHEAVGVVEGGVDEVVRTMEARMAEMRDQYEKRIEEMQSATKQLQRQHSNKPHVSPVSPPRPASVGPVASRTPLRSAIRSPLRPPRSASASRLQSPTRPQYAVESTTPATSVPSVPSDVSQPSSPRARPPAPLSRAQQSHHQLHSHGLPSAAAFSVGSTDLDAHFQQLHTLLQSSHRSDLTALATHYTQLLTTLQHHTRTQLDTMQQRLTTTESERQRLADAVTQLQGDVWKREREAEEKGWEVERWRERPGVKEYVLLERQVREMEARMARREKEYREEADMAELRAEEERVRLVDRFEGIVKRKNDQLRAFEHEMEQLIDLLHTTQQQLHQHNKRSTAVANREAAPSAALRERDEREEREMVGGSVVDGGGAGVGVVNYVALLDRLEQQQSAVYQQLTASNKGKENKGRVSLTAKSTVGRPIVSGVSGTVAQSEKTAFRRVSVGAGVKRAPFAPQPTARRAQ